MGVCTNDYISCHGKSFFREQRMFNSHLPYIKIVGNVMSARKFPHAFTVLC